MTPSTTNTAARELLASALDECGRPTDAAEVREGRNPLVRGEYALTAIEKALTQQQGGEQEAVEFDRWHAGRAMPPRETDPYHWRVEYEARKRDDRAVWEAALRSKQPAASEGDKYLDQLCHVVHALTGDEGEDDPLTVLERYAANGATLTYPDDDNTSKQAAGEAVACPCGAARNDEEGPYPINREATLFRLDCVDGECGWAVIAPTAAQALLDWDRRATTPPRHPADEVVAIHACTCATERDRELCMDKQSCRVTFPLAGTP